MDTGTVPDVPGPLGEHLKGKTTIYFLDCALCMALQPMFCYCLCPFLEVTTDFFTTFSGKLKVMKMDSAGQMGI